MKDKLDRKMKVLLIFLEHPGGLHFAELWRIVEKQGICAKETLSKTLEQLRESPNPLIEVNELRRYTLRLSESVSQIIKKGVYELPKQIEKDLDMIYKSYEQSGKKQAELFVQLATGFLTRSIMQITAYTWLLFPILFDKKIRDIWFFGYKNAYDVLFNKFDEISQKFYGVKVSYALGAKPIQERFMTPSFETDMRQIKLENEKMANLVESLEIEDHLKNELKRQICAEFT